MKKLLLVLITNFCLTSVLVAQSYTTPDTGTTFSLDDLVTASPSTISVSGTTYTLAEDLTISATDELLIDSDITLEIAQDILITVFGTFNVDSNSVIFTAVDPAAPYEGFRFEQFSTINIQNATIEYGGGLRVLTETFTINNSLITNNVSGVATGGVIALSRGVAQITNNTITFNETPAISSGANSATSPYIFNNYIEGNNQANSNRPQINMGTTLENTPLQIIQNTIKGDINLDQVGGIAVSNFVSGAINAIIDDNVIFDNRYGLTILGGNSFAYVRNNVIEDNNTQNSPNLGGSGISLNSSTNDMNVIASGNEIRRNLWGITVIGDASINLGDGAGNVGENVFADNGNGGITYALYNNTSNALTAMNNCWDENNPPNSLAEAEAVIVHQNDIGSLGLVTFDPVNCGFLSLEDESLNTLKIFPNPTNGEVTILNNMDYSTLSIYALDGKLILEKALMTGENNLDLSLNAGMYVLQFNGASTRATHKLVVE